MIASSLSVSPLFLYHLCKHAREDFPKECCGFLIGDHQRFHTAIPSPNKASNPYHFFEICPSLHCQIQRHLRESHSPFTIRGIYHSHPYGTPFPSSLDIQLATGTMFDYWMILAIDDFSINGAHLFKKEDSQWCYTPLSINSL